ncbi:ATP-binding cassette transporter snq2 [Fusarium solani]
MRPFLSPMLLANSNHGPGFHAGERESGHNSHVIVSQEAEEAIAELHNTITNESDPRISELGKYLRNDQQSRIRAFPLSVCFKSVSAYGQSGGIARDAYEWTFKRVISPDRGEKGQALIRDFSGVVRSGEMMLVLGNPGAGCSTFLRIIGNDHSSFLGVKGYIAYSGLSPDEVQKRFRGAVSYVPEDDIHLPTLTGRQTLEFALQNKTPKKCSDQIPRFLDEFGRAFGMTQSMDTLVGNEYIRGISGGERKRISILESLASGASVQAWDGPTRGLDASSALDYIKSLRLMTDACQRATIVSLYQASDTIFGLMDKVMLIDQGRMLYQGPAKTAEAYFNALGYNRLPRQTMSDFLTSIASGQVSSLRVRNNSSVPKSALDLEQAFRASQAFKDVQDDIHRYESEFEEHQSSSQTGAEGPSRTSKALKHHTSLQKSNGLRSDLTMKYLTPAFYTFEILMVVEFRGREFPCGKASIIPAGPAYNDASYQVCAYRGISPGQLSLNGDDYVKDEFGFSFDNVGRNYGILILFLVAPCLLNMWLVENVDWVSGQTQALESAHDVKAPLSSQKCDEESTDERRVQEREKPDMTTRQANGSFRGSGMTFSWRNINYSVRQHNKDKQLLRNVSGFCRPGTLTALVGSSGAGKSTLMTVLSQQAAGDVSGEIKVDNDEIDPSFGRRIGFCQQMDIHLETSTVREAFEFSALLRQNSKISREDKITYVSKILDILEMSELQNILIRSLSLEQKKRTTIGVELCANPDLLLFLDEPTSGLDGQGAMSIVRLLRRLADSGQTILCTIHQASQEQFELFDRVLALDRGGQVYYFGDIGVNGRAVIDYFTRHGVTVEPDKNVADLLIEVAARKSRDTEHDWCQIWQDSDEVAVVLRAIDTITTAVRQAPREQGPSMPHDQYASPTYQQILLLTKRTLLQYWRTPDYIYSRLYCSFAHSLLNGLIFLRLGNTRADMQYRIFSCFLILMIIPEFINACAMMFDDNRSVWLGREYPGRIYGWVAFTTANVIAEIPYALAGGVLFYVLFYFIVGLPLGEPAGYTFLMMMMFHLFSTSWGQWIVALSTDKRMAANIMPFFVVMCEFFNGVLQPKELMPAVWRYTMYYIGPFTYWISGIVAMILGRVSVRCLDSELIRFEAPPNTTCGEYANDWLSGSKGMPPVRTI